MVSLTDLKPGCRLHVLITMAILGAPATKERITDRCGWSDEAVRDALRWLSAPDQALALCIPNGRWPVWSLTATARQLLLPIRQMLVEAEAMSPLPADSTPAAPPPAQADLSPLPADSDHAHNQLPLSKAQDFPEKPAPPAESAPSGLRPPNNSNKDIDSNDIGELMEQFKIALERANVHKQLRRELARDLIAEDGPGWLRQVLGWIAQLHGESAQTRGATIWPALRDRDLCDETYLPPAGLNFTQALAWAERGAQQPPEPAAPAPIFDDDALAIPEHEHLWRQVLDQMRLQLRQHPDAMNTLYNTFLEPGAAPNHYTIVCPNKWTRDYLANRMVGKLQHELNAAAGTAVALTFRAAD